MESFYGVKDVEGAIGWLNLDQDDKERDGIPTLFKSEKEASDTAKDYGLNSFFVAEFRNNLEKNW